MYHGSFLKTSLSKKRSTTWTGSIRFLSERAQAHNSLGRVVKDSKVFLRIQVPLEIYKHAVQTLVTLDEIR